MRKREKAKEKRKYASGILAFHPTHASPKINPYLPRRHKNEKGKD